MHVVIQVLPALERPPASCVWPALCWEPRWRTPCWSWTPPTTGEAPLRTTSGCLVDWELTVSFLSAGASTWWGTRSRCLLSRRSHCPKDGTRSSFWTKPTGKQAVQWLFKNKEIPILRQKIQGNMKYEGAASRKICWQRPRRSCSHWAFVSWSPSLWKLQKTCFAPTKATERVKLQ